MLPPLPASQTALLLAGVGAAGLLMLRLLLPSWWRNQWVRRAAFAAIGFPALGVLMWELGVPLGLYPVSSSGVVIAWSSLIPLSFLVGSLPLTALVRWLLLRGIPSRSAPSPQLETNSPTPLSRRHLVQAGASLVPAVAFGTGLKGLLAADNLERIPIVPMRYPNLPPDLHGLRILHLSDLHLGCNKHVEDLERFLERAKAYRPDMVVLTGDVAEDVRQLPDALALVSELSPRLGVFGVLGNHEYYRDVERARSAYRRTGVPLLVNGGVSQKVGRAVLSVAGIDDPIATRGNVEHFMRRNIDAALGQGSRDSFVVLLSHRPRAFVHSAERRVGLTLAGHTHGGQIVMARRTVSTLIDHEPFPWGRYTRRGSRLYTTAGFGHWFPYRLHCPAEVPLIVLTGE